MENAAQNWTLQSPILYCKVAFLTSVRAESRSDETVSDKTTMPQANKFFLSGDKSKNLKKSVRGGRKTHLPSVRVPQKTAQQTDLSQFSASVLHKSYAKMNLQSSMADADSAICSRSCRPERMLTNQRSPQPLCSTRDEMSRGSSPNPQGMEIRQADSKSASSRLSQTEAGNLFHRRP
jgi:hypothetical protein